MSLTLQSPTLYYVHDPMCSWCWGFSPTLRRLLLELDKQQPSLKIEFLVGGLAPDNDNPMSKEQQSHIISIWQKIEALLGTEFNYDFWKLNQAQRSTYMSCRAVLAAKNQNLEKQMIEKIQQAYYLRALNPSDKHILTSMAFELYNEEYAMHLDQFTDDLVSMATEKKLQSQIKFSQALGAKGFPSLILQVSGESHLLAIDYQNVALMLEEINKLLPAV